MKRKKLLNRLADYFNLGRRKQCQRKEKLKDILKHLRQKERKLQKKAENEQNGIKRKRLRKEVQIIHAQRLKGLKRLKELQCD